MVATARGAVQHLAALILLAIVFLSGRNSLAGGATALSGARGAAVPAHRRLTQASQLGRTDNAGQATAATSSQSHPAAGLVASLVQNNVHVIVSGSQLSRASTPGYKPSPVTEIPLHPGYTCEAPYSDGVRLHVIITILDRQGYRDLRYLGMLGLSNADVFVYLRTDPNDKYAAKVKLPCGMRFHERLLLPNLGEEGAAFVTHVAAVYDDMPDAIIALHGGKLSSWHARCSVAIRRMRAFYQGLGPQATPAMKALASNVITLNSYDSRAMKGRGWIVNDCCGPLFSKIATPHDYEQCPWERVGEASVRFYGHPQPLCQLRDRTPDTNWTVLAIDVPEFFIKPREILAKYENDPLQRVPITHARTAPDSASKSAAATEPYYPYDVSVLADMAASRGLSGAVPRSQGRRLQRSETAAAAGSTEQERLVNLRDVVLPNNRASALRKDGPAYVNHKVYGLDRMWAWILQAHGMHKRFNRRPKEGEVSARWCCFQFAMPKSVVYNAPKGWWTDVAFMATHLAWRDWQEWPVSIGLLVEYRMWASLDRHWTSKADLQAYLDADRELGEDALLGQCDAAIQERL